MYCHRNTFPVLIYILYEQCNNIGHSKGRVLLMIPLPSILMLKHCYENLKGFDQSLFSIQPCLSPNLLFDHIENTPIFSQPLSLSFFPPSSPTQAL